MYRIKDYNNDIIESFFYEPELQMAYIGDEVVYKIEKIIKKRKRKNQGFSKVERLAREIQFMDTRRSNGKYIRMLQRDVLDFWIAVFLELKHFIPQLVTVSVDVV